MLPESPFNNELHIDKEELAAISTGGFRRRGRMRISGISSRRFGRRSRRDYLSSILSLLPEY